MIATDSRSCSTLGGDNLEKSLIHFEEEISTSVSPVTIHPVLGSTNTTGRKESKNQNITSCICAENDKMRHNLNIQKKICSPSHRYYYSHLTTKRKLLFLVFVASLALLSIILISEQLIVRHLSRQFDSNNDLYHHHGGGNPYNHIEVYEELDILTLEEWAHHQTIDFDDKLFSPHGGQEGGAEGQRGHQDIPGITLSRGKC